ncbi:MAG: HlyD family efflux transporter periplasmic adaptor subunit [Clostridiales bacterium]|nr:HlyD family efflux transporter periplasmic adaptor subunit [Candidatus Coliplasma caballi]
MRKSIIAVLLALSALLGFACAEVYSGVTAAASEIGICAEADGVLERVWAEAGDTVDAGGVLAEYRTEKVFASQDGTVAAIHYAEGDHCCGSVLEIMPVERYRIYCTAENAYQSAESTLLHSGERVYIKCTVNGTHRGVGTVTNIDGSEYGVLTVGGDFHVGETVYLYRDAEFSAKQRVGIGTVVENDTEKYAADGTLVKLCVEEGEEIERGQLLYETVSGSETDVRTDISGIVSSVNVSSGDTVQKGQIIASVMPENEICVEISVGETEVAKFRKGMRAEITFAADRDETLSYGTVSGVAQTDEDGLYRIMIIPDSGDGLRLGMTANVWIE